MTLRISTERSAVAAIRLAGRLEGADVIALQRSCGEIPELLSVDLSEVDFADDGGIEALKQLRQRGATLHGARPYLALLLDETGCS